MRKKKDCTVFQDFEATSVKQKQRHFAVTAELINMHLCFHIMCEAGFLTTGLILLFMKFKNAELFNIIRITFPCNTYPLIPHFCIAKLKYAGVYLQGYTLFLLQNIDCGFLVR